MTRCSPASRLPAPPAFSLSWSTACRIPTFKFHPTLYCFCFFPQWLLVSRQWITCNGVGIMKVFKPSGLLSFVVLTTLSSAPAYVVRAQERQSEYPSEPRKEAIRETTGSNVVVSPEEDYRIGSNDVIEIFVLKAPELSRSYKVNADGTIEMPFVGKVNVQNKTSQELAKLIANGFRGGKPMRPQRAG